MRQTGFSFIKSYKKEFGGSLLVGKRKSRRPLSTKHPMHLILKSSGNKIFHPANPDMDKIVRSNAKRFGIKIYDLAVNWTHFHILIKIPTRQAYVHFIRSTTAKLVLYFNKKSGWSLKGLFDLRPYTKILSWGPQLEKALCYILKNQFEATGRKRHKSGKKIQAIHKPPPSPAPI